MDVRLQQTVERLTQNDPTLQKLGLCYSYIGAAGAQAIADALRQNSTLQQLELSDSGIGAARAQAIKDILRSNSKARNATRLAAQHVVPRMGVRYNVPGLPVQVIQLCLVPSEIVMGFVTHEAAASVPEEAGELAPGLAPLTASVVEDVTRTEHAA